MRFIPSFFQVIASVPRALKPFLSLGSAFFLESLWMGKSVIPWPDLLSGIIYYWGISHPSASLVLSLFFWGGIKDGLTHTPLGFHSLLWLLFYVLIVKQRRFLMGKSFSLIWTGYALNAFLFFIFKIIILDFFWKGSLSLMPVLFSYGISVSLYPLIATVLSGGKNPQNVSGGTTQGTVFSSAPSKTSTKPLRNSFTKSSINSSNSSINSCSKPFKDT